jgi:predicted acetyltransferase
VPTARPTAEVPNFLHYYDEGMPFGRYLEILEQHTRGENVPPGHVPSTFLFAFQGPRIVGRVSIRHELSEFLLRIGGHIGYTVGTGVQTTGICDRDAPAVARDHPSAVRSHTRAGDVRR